MVYDARRREPETDEAQNREEMHARMQEMLGPMRKSVEASRGQPRDGRGAGTRSSSDSSGRV